MRASVIKELGGFTPPISARPDGRAGQDFHKRVSERVDAGANHTDVLGLSSVQFFGSVGRPAAGLLGCEVRDTTGRKKRGLVVLYFGRREDIPALYALLGKVGQVD